MKVWAPLGVLQVVAVSTAITLMALSINGYMFTRRIKGALLDSDKEVARLTVNIEGAREALTSRGDSDLAFSASADIGAIQDRIQQTEARARALVARASRTLDKATVIGPSAPPTPAGGHHSAEPVTSHGVERSGSEFSSPPMPPRTEPPSPPRQRSDRPSIAILGLEVYDSGDGIDAETAQVARELTAALRDRARAGDRYTPAQDGEKELIDEKLLNSCDAEAPTCMAAIGSGLGADVLMYGRIEKARNGQGIYLVSIKLLSVGRKQLVSSTVETLPVADSTGVMASTRAKVWYAKLTGVVSGGTLAVHASIDRGTVLLDDKAVGNLSSGGLVLSGVPEGGHTLAIEAKDYQRYERSITVRSGETTQTEAKMVPASR